MRRYSDAVGNLNRNCDPRRLAWLMTDERFGEALIPAIRALPPGAGVVFRHYCLPRDQRHRLFLRVRRLAQAQRLRLSVGGRAMPGAARHGGRGALTYPAHDRRQAIAGLRSGATWLFVSPLYATRSHPGSSPLGVRKALAMVGGLDVQVVALGGMTAARWLRIRQYGFAGWAAIDGLMVVDRPVNRTRPAGQKRKAVPT